MSFLQGAGPNFSKLVISLWFRVPSGSIRRATEQAARYRAEADAVANAGGFLPPPPFNGVVPIMMFGDGAIHKSFTAHFVSGGPALSRLATWLDGAICQWLIPDYNVSEINLLQWFFNDLANYNVAPSYIGVDCKPDPETGIAIPRLAINIQTQVDATFSGSSWQNEVSLNAPPYTGWQLHSKPDCPNGPGGHIDPESGDFILDPQGSYSDALTVESAASVVYGNTPVNFRTIPENETVTDFAKHGKRVTPDHWHHILVSFDFSIPCITRGRMEKTFNPTNGLIISAPKLYVAFDNVNLTRKTLSWYWEAGGTDNDLLSVGAHAIYKDNHFPVGTTTQVDDNAVVYTHVVTGEAAGAYNSLTSDISMTPFGIPGMDAHDDSVKHIEMAELQVYANDVLDTSNASNREPFIFNGKPVPPAQEAAASNNNRPGAIEFMGREPDILLHKSGRWIKGDNTGAGSDFNPTGRIIRYVPDPSLSGPQGPPQD